MTTRRTITSFLLVLLLGLLGVPVAAHATPRPVDPAPAEPGGELPIEPGPRDTAPVEAAPDEPAPTETTPSETPSSETAPPATAPAGPETTPPAATAPAESAPTAPESEEPPLVVPNPRAKRRHRAERPPELPAEEPSAPLAENTTRTVQVIVQVQIGCRHHCTDTSQTQTAIQDAHVDQTAIAPDGTARNDSVIEQYIWQLQLGCVAFCTGTVQTQTAEQRAQTTQTAIGADTVNSARTVQMTHQRQRARRGRGRALLAGIDRLLRALARETAATIQLIRQVQIADCLHHCTGDAQVQLAVQQAVTAQEAAARSVTETD